VGAVTSTCSSLFTVATDNGEKAGIQPLDTATAMINIARFPAGNHSAGAANVDATFVHDIFAIPTGTTPYVPQLSEAPNDWTIAINYPNTAITGYPTAVNNTLGQAESIAVDDIGQIWVTAQTGFFINRFSNLGANNSLDTLTYIPGYVSIDGSNNAWTGNANCNPGNPACPNGTSIFEAGSNGVFTNQFGGGYDSAYVVLTDKSDDVFFFAQTSTGSNGAGGTSGTAPDYGMFEYPLGGTTLAGPFNCCGTSTTGTVSATAPLDILAATNTGGVFTFVISPVSSAFTTPLAVGDTVTISTPLTNDPGAGNSPAAVGWNKLTSLKVTSVNNAANPTSFTATSNTTTTPTPTNTVSTNTNGPLETINITSTSETSNRRGGVTTFTYTFHYTPAAGAPALAVGDTVGLNLANDAGTGRGGTAATGWQNLTSATISTIVSTTEFQATGTTVTTDNNDGNGATGTGTYNINGATGAASFPSTTVTTTSTTGPIPSGQNVGHGAIDSAGDLWITSENTGNTIARVNQLGVPAFTPIVTAEQPEFPAIDHANNAWIAIQETAAQVDVVSPTGGLTVLTPTGTGGTIATGALMTSTFGAAVDGNGNVWFANRGSNYGNLPDPSGVAGTNSIFVLNGGVSTPGTVDKAISPPTNYVPEAQYPATATSFTPILDGSLNLAIDPSGNLWITNYTGSGIVEIVGAAAPVVTPLSVAAGNNQLGQKP
jgi:hypothetical protein